MDNYNKEIYQLEIKLITTEIRSSRIDLESILDEEFVEFTSSGKVVTKTQMIEILTTDPGAQYKITNFRTTQLSPFVEMATYIALKQTSEDSEPQSSLRCSIWQYSEDRWRILFHQGTPILGSPPNH